MLALKKSHWINLAMILALLAVALAGRHYSPLLLPAADLSLAADPGCDLQRGPCGAALPGGGRLEFSVTPRPIPYLQPVRVEVALSGVKATRVEVDFAGESMNMGYNRVALDASGSGAYAAQASLPVCVTGGMTWIATVIVEAPGQRIQVPYRFDTGR